MNFNATKINTKIPLLFLCSLILICKTQGQSSEIFKTVAQLPMIDIGFSFEKSITNSVSFQIGLHHIDTKFYNEKSTLSKKTKPIYEDEGVGGVLAIRYYPLIKGSSLKGLYISPKLEYQRHNLIYRDKIGEESVGFILVTKVHIYSEGNKNVSTMNAGFEIGYQKNWGNFILDMGCNFLSNRMLGDGSNVILENGTEKEYKSSINGLNAKLMISIGYNFWNLRHGNSTKI